MSKKLVYVPKLVINGTEVETRAKQVTFKIKDNEVNINCCYINENELSSAYKSQFEVTTNGKDIKVIYVKAENRVSATIYIDSVLAFSSLSIQAVFTVLNSAYGLSKSSLNNLYVKSNSTRKQASKNTNQITVDSSFEF